MRLTVRALTQMPSKEKRPGAFRRRAFFCPKARYGSTGLSQRFRCAVTVLP